MNLVSVHRIKSTEAGCLGSDDMNSNSVTVEVLGCETLACGRVLLDCAATDTLGSVDAIHAIFDKSQEAFGADHDWVSVDTNDRPALSKVRVKVQPGGHVAHLHVHAQETEGVLVLWSAESITALGAVIDFETGHSIFRNLEHETGVQLERSPMGPLWNGSVRTNASGQQQSVVVVRSHEVWSKCWFDVANTESSCVVAHNDSGTDSQHPFWTDARD